jgi:hypothetical protein
MNPADREARKQVLLTRIAFERVEMRRELAHVREATHVPRLLRAALGFGLGRPLFNAGGAPEGGWLHLAMSLLRRYRVAAALLGGVAPVLRGRGLRRLIKFGLMGAAAWFGWSLVRKR